MAPFDCLSPVFGIDSYSLICDDELVILRCGVRCGFDLESGL